MRRRSCTNPAPERGGRQCRGSDSRICNERECPPGENYKTFQIIFTMIFSNITNSNNFNKNDNHNYDKKDNHNYDKDNYNPDHNK